MREGIPDGWKAFELGQVCDVVGGGTPERGKPEYWNGEIRWVSPTEITALRTRYISDTKEKITELGLSKSSAKLHPVGTVLMTSRASIGYPAINTVPMATNQGFQSLRCNGNADSEFVFQWVIANQPALERLSSGSTFSEISSTNVKKVPIVLPPKPEQQKIASILTTVDDLIEKTEAQIGKLQDLKKGMMQELLTKGIGHTEFKDSPVGQIPKEWGVVSLGEVVSDDSPICYGILMPGKGAQNGVPVIKVKDIRDNNVDTSDLLLTSHEIDQQFQRSRLNAGDLLVTIRGTTGRVAIVPNSLDGANITQDTARIRIATEDLALYVFLFLQGPSAQYQIESHTIGQAVKGINLAEVRKVQIALPPKDERREISRSLSSLDNRLSLCRKRLSGVTALKKALMQDLLTGKVRVKVN